ncbi:MAG: hypothetical protein ACSHYF_16800 [Verrucomicrobiaceae bacterium]
MQNLETRRKHALLLRCLVAGRLSNDEYEDGLADDFDDGSNRVFFEGGWYLYSDTKEYRLEGRHKLDRESKRQVARWIMFLRSSADYLWPAAPSFLGVRRLLCGLSGGKWFSESIGKYDALMDKGDLAVWPFFDQKQFRSELASPSYFHGQQRANRVGGSF